MTRTPSYLERLRTTIISTCQAGDSGGRPRSSLVSLECEYQAVEGQFEEPAGIVDDVGLLYACQRGVARPGKGSLRLAVLLLAARHVAAWGLAGLGERMADEEPGEAVGPVCGCSSLRPASNRMEISDSRSVNAGWVTGGRVPSSEMRWG